MGTRTPSKHVKVVIAGEAHTGKSSLLSQHAQLGFDSGYVPSTEVEFSATQVKCEDGSVSMYAWIVPGDFASLIRSAYYGKANCAALICDMTDRKSLYILERWRADLLSYNTPALAFVLVGNKADIPERQIEWSEAYTWARRHGNMPFFETSAKEGVNVEAMFEEVVRLAVRNQRNSW